MIQKKKKLMLALLAMLIMLTSNMAIYAAVPTDIQPFWINTSDIVVGLSITNGKAVLSASVEGYSGVNSITAVAVLERLNSNGTYTEIESWNDISGTNRWLDWSSTRYVTKGYTYRFTYTTTVTRNGVSETISGSKSAAA